MYVAKAVQRYKLSHLRLMFGRADSPAGRSSHLLIAQPCPPCHRPCMHHVDHFIRCHMLAPAQSPMQPGYASRFFAGAAAVAADIAAGAAAAYLPGVSKKGAKKVINEVHFHLHACFALRDDMLLGGSQQLCDDLALLRDSVGPLHWI